MIEIEHSKCVERIDPLLEEWHKEQRGNDYGVDVSVKVTRNDIADAIEFLDGEIILALKDKEEVGFLVIFPMKSLVGDQLAGFEKYWYVKPGFNAGLELFREAQKWSKEHSCSLLVMCASNLASNIHDKVCKFYKTMGMKLFETTYIMEVR